jgi:type I restriction enzyme S subunit
MTAPKLRFKEFDGDWGKKKFSEQFNFHNTNSYSRALLAEQGEIMNIHYGDIHTKFSMLFDVKEEAVPFLSGEVDTNKIAENQFLQVGDLVIADASEDYKDIGKAIEVINLDNQKVVAGLHTYIARPVERCAIGFNGYLMQTFEVREQIKKLATGISVLGISKTNLGKVELKIPCLAEQTKIASFLSAVDEKISQLSQKLHLLSQYKQGMMKKLFSQQIRFKADDGSQFEEWVTKTIKELNLYISDGNYGELYPTSAQFVSHGVPFIRANNIKNLKVTKNDMRFIDENLHQILNSGHLKTNDIIVTTRGDIGMVALVDSSHEGSNINAQICLLRVVDQSQLSPQFLLYFLDSSFGQKQFKELQTGTALKQLPKKSLDKIITLVPSINEQTKIANFLSAIDQKIDVVSEQLKQAKLWKKGLLQQMFV